MQQTEGRKRNVFSMSLKTLGIRHKAKSVRKAKALGKERLFWNGISRFLLGSVHQEELLLLVPKGAETANIGGEPL